MEIKKILVSQPKPASDKSPYFDVAKKYGIEVVFRPFIKTEPVTSKEFRMQRINLADFTAVIFTSKIAIDIYFDFCKEYRVTVPETMRYFCSTESVALYLQKYIVYRKRKIVFGRTGKIDDMTAALTKHSKEKFLFPVADVHKDDQFEVLRRLQIDFTPSVMYKTVGNDFEAGESKDYDVFLLFTPSGVSSFVKNFPDYDTSKMKIGAFGPAAVEAVKASGVLTLDIEAPTPQSLSMASALDRYLGAIMDPIVV